VYDPVHEAEARWNLELFKKNELESPSKQHDCAISDLLYLLRRALSSTEEFPVVVRLDPDSPELSRANLVGLFDKSLPAVVFSDDPITKMHDSLPTVVFRFEILVKLYEARELAWVAYIFPWMLLNEGMSHKQVDAYDRVRWFQMACIYLMKMRAIYESRPVGPEV
jgi:hypothetical protein